jgi:ribosomal protein L33
MNLGMFDRFYPSLKARVKLEERFDLNKFDRNRERYVIPMHRKNFYRLQAHHYDPSV